MKKTLLGSAICLGLISLILSYSCGGSPASSDATAATAVAIQNVIQDIGLKGVSSSARVNEVEATSTDGTNVVNHPCAKGGTVTGTSTVTGVSACTASSPTCNVTVDATVDINNCAEADTTCGKGNLVANGKMAVTVTATGTYGSADTFNISVSYKSIDDLTVTYNSKTIKCGIDTGFSGTVTDLLSGASMQSLMNGTVCGADWKETWTNIGDATKKAQICADTTATTSM